jgi:hypothetical protein
VSFARLRALALALPEAEERTMYGTPAFYVRRKFFARMREDGETLVLRIDPDELELRLRSDPKAFHLTDHYVGWSMILVRLPAVGEPVLREMLAGSWRRSAPGKLVAAFDAGK